MIDMMQFDGFYSYFETDLTVGGTEARVILIQQFTTVDFTEVHKHNNKYIVTS